MPVTWTTIAQGYAPIADTGEVTVPASTYYVDGKLRLFNEHATQQVVSIKKSIDAGVTKVQIGRSTLAQNESDEIDIGHLGPAHLLYVTTTTASALRYSFDATVKS